jgi:hypothetical protein
MLTTSRSRTFDVGKFPKHCPTEREFFPELISLKGEIFNVSEKENLLELARLLRGRMDVWDA